MTGRSPAPRDSWDNGGRYDRVYVPGTARSSVWRDLLAAAVERLGPRGVESPDVDARRMGEEATGQPGAGFRLRIDDLATGDEAARFDAMVARRLTGEPLQYVLGRWGFRTLDLVVDRRVLIPRPETEQVVEQALVELDDSVARFRAREDPVESTSNRRRRRNVVDLGCGSGAIGLSIAAERDDVNVWCVDAAAGAIAVTARNLAHVDLRGSRVTMVRGSWFEPLPPDLAGDVDLIVANPPYVAAGEELPAVVSDWEPVAALVAGPTGLEAIHPIVEQAPRWLADEGVLAMEIGATQAAAVTEAAHRAGLVAIQIRRDLAGRDRMLVARRS